MDKDRALEAVKKEYAKYKTEFDMENKSMTEMLNETREKYDQLILAQENFDRQKMHSEQVIEAANKSLEDEVAFRKNIEKKMNDMHNQVVCAKNAESGLQKKVDDNELVMKQQDEKIINLTKEVIELRSWKEKSFMKYGQYDTEIKQFKKDAAIMTKKMQDLIADRQRAEFKTATKANANVQLHEKLSKQEGTIKALKG